MARTRAAVVFALLAVVSSSVAAAQTATASTGQGARATLQAVRGEQVRVRPIAQTECLRVAVVGDSLTAASTTWMGKDLEDLGVAYAIDGQVSRRIPSSVRDPYSGVSAARHVRASWGEADCWVIALGSNDLLFGGGDPQRAAAMVEEQVAALTPSSRVWWVNVDYRMEPSTTFDFPAATAVFNAVLEVRAARDTGFRVVDWFSLLESNPQWFVDSVHVRSPGYVARSASIAAELAS